MNLLHAFTLRLCGMIIGLYPRHFREQFGAEMQFVLRTRLDAAMQDGHVVSVCLHEIVGVLKGLIREYAIVIKAFGGRQPSGAGLVWLGVCGIMLMFRLAIVSYWCNLANPASGGFVNRAACYIYRQDPGSWFLSMLAILMVTPLVWSVFRDATRREQWNSQRVLRFICYSLVGAVCGIIAQLSPRPMRLIPLPYVLTLLLYVVGVWLLPALMAMMIEMRREHHRATLALTTIIVWLSAVQTYYLCYAAMIALGVAGPQLETLQVVGTGAENWDNFRAFFHYVIRSLMLPRTGIAIVFGAVFGTIVGLLGTWRDRLLKDEQSANA